MARMTFQPYPSHSTPYAGDAEIGDAALVIRNLVKTFTDKVAVNNLNLTVPKGSFYGIVGPNGAGKTTAILAATGIIRPDSGNSWVAGHPLWADLAEGTRVEEEVLAAKRSYGLLVDGLPVFERLSGKEYLEYLGYLRDIPGEELQQRIADLLRALDLEDAGKKYIADYSAGMKKKILLAGALLHSPEVLILDEPFEAVDPVSGEVIRTILRRYVEAGGTVILSSHVMELVEGLCNHVAIINQGTVVAAGTTEQVRAGKSLSERFVEAVGGKQLDTESFGWLRGGSQSAHGTQAHGPHEGQAGVED